uniref:Uncharacterized protein n=1 Tax=Arundo donax TaxID=35708 RepID=A0A0A9CX29_ARUDO
MPRRPQRLQNPAQAPPGGPTTWWRAPLGRGLWST